MRNGACIAVYLFRIVEGMESGVNMTWEKVEGVLENVHMASEVENRDWT